MQKSPSYGTVRITCFQKGSDKLPAECDSAKNILENWFEQCRTVRAVFLRKPLSTAVFCVLLEFEKKFARIRFSFWQEQRILLLKANLVFGSGPCRARGGRNLKINKAWLQG